MIKSYKIDCSVSSTNYSEPGVKNSIDDNIKKYISFDGFEILDIIYQRNNISIYKSIYKKNKIQKILAIKLIKKDKKKSSQISNEISIHQKLKHLHIIDLLGYNDLSSSSTMIYDYQKFGDLHQFTTSFLKRRVLSETFLCYLAGQILEALKYLHRNKILHLDLKPKNILVNDFMQFKLIDYSISIDYRNKEYIKLPLAGTFGYMSPEVLNGKKIKAKDASKVDIFSFGVLLYFSAYGEYPYGINNLNDKEYDKMAEYIEKNELKFPEGFKYSYKFKSVLQKCLDKKFDNRYDIYNICDDDWIKGGEIIKDYKEKLCNTNIFLIDAISDNIIDFNKHLE